MNTETGSIHDYDEALDLMRKGFPIVPVSNEVARLMRLGKQVDDAKISLHHPAQMAAPTTEQLEARVAALEAAEAKRERRRSARAAGIVLVEE